MKYKKVLPRDLFNDAKLLKCLGQLCLFIHDGIAPAHKLMFEHNGEAFDIRLLEEGSLMCDNITFYYGKKKVRLYFKTTYNSKAAYPLVCEYREVEYQVFNEYAIFHEDFIELINNVI